jgi:hypothetical protein
LLSEEAKEGEKAKADLGKGREGKRGNFVTAHVRGRERNRRVEKETELKRKRDGSAETKRRNNLLILPRHCILSQRGGTE